MSSLVSDFIINPVLRQARRFSEISRSTFAADDHETPVTTAEPSAVSDPDVLAAVEHQESPVTMDHGDAEPVARPQTPHSRPVSASTQETRVEVALEASPSNSTTNHDHLGFPLSARRRQGIPEDDGMHELRRRIQAVNSQDISPEEKARRMHELLLEGYRTSQAGVQSRGQTPLKEIESLGPADEPSTSPGPLESLKSWYTQQEADQTAAAEKFVLSDSDVAPTFAPLRQRKGSDDDLQALSPTSPTELQAALGCQHYERNVKLQCFTCKKWYTCRFCHDAEEDHNLVRTETRNMLCMLCATPQKASDVCINCGEVSAYYYCNICKLWENRKSRPIYHCSDCGICRRGEGLGKDFFHCKTCRACITTSIRSSHKCIERSTDCDCPICGEYLFTSPRPVVFMLCGHSIHKKCYEQHMRVSYKCPLCNKSLANMETQFRNLDVAILSQPMPAEFRNTRVTVLCNDCSGKSSVAYHWLGLKCSICQSYNTVEFQVHGEREQELRPLAPRTETAPITQTLLPEFLRIAANSPADPSSGRPRHATRSQNRRRHSSQGVELQSNGPGRLARPSISLDVAEDGTLTQARGDVDSDDDIFGFWRGNGSRHGADDDDDGASEEDESDEGSDEDDGADDDDEDEDEDDEDDIQLIGHR
ncbi:CHY zinc finger containing protein [Moelleriella libera RCEF 2490]|uniref:CHY zinc finger containing protein n=1 Tax=Moelleriella libera RCEF 2490 TaxID=1081109 RepID=A0A168CP77_9HYPO|nr:CHY zinc finger containing protein [Moelleriella libera RCEF 2490]